MIRRNGQVLGSVLVAGLNTSPPSEVVEPVPVVEPVAPPVDRVLGPVSSGVDGTGVPKHYANKPEWVDYAVNHAPDGKRLSVDEANELSKQDLIDLFGGE